MNKKIIISLSIIGVAAVAAIGATVSYFSNTETSTGNTFIAGAIDLKVDNTCHYNGKVCALYSHNNVAPNGYYWNGDPAQGACSCTWELSDLDGKAIFNFTDVKPGDVGEDTISLHVDSNPAWVCAEVSNIAQRENGCNPPEKKVDGTCDDPGLGQGELWDNLRFSIWMDNGIGGGIACNNIKDGGETYLVENTEASAAKWAIADSQHGSAIQDACIGVAWSVPDAVGNIIQGDSVTGDITFNAYQARNNDGFLCNPPVGGTLIVKKVVNGGTKTASDFSFQIDGGTAVQFEADGQNNVAVSAGTYSVTEPAVVNYATSYDNCTGVVIANGETKTCTITNTINPGNLIVHKIVITHVEGTETTAANFQMTIDGNNVTQDVSNPVTPGNHTVGEVSNPNYTETFSAECPNGIANVPAGTTVTCTVTNEQLFATLTLNKVVINTHGGNNVAADFLMYASGIDATTQLFNGVPKNVAVGSLFINEQGVTGYQATFNPECASGQITLAAGESKQCTITNQDLPANITLIKAVDSGAASPLSFLLRIDGVYAPQSTSVAVDSNTAHVINEDAHAGYHFVSITGDAKCPAALGGTATLNEGEAITCTIHNAINTP